MKNFHYATIAAIICLVAVSAFLFATADDSDAASVDSQRLTLFTPDTDNYSSLAYRGDALPDGMNPARYTRTADGYWYNIDTGSNANGTFLTYGDLVPVMSVTDIRADMQARFGPGYLVAQVSFRVTEACNVSYTITKDGTAYVPTAMSASLSVNGFNCRSYSYAVQYLVGTDFVPADIVGEYVLDVKCDGSSIGTYAALYDGGKVYVTGTITDASGRPISDVLVYYTKSTGSVGNSPTDSAGHYSITCALGEWVKITSATKSNYTFIFDPYNTGDLTGDFVVPDIKSLERSVRVNITDSSGTFAIPNATVMGEWFLENLDPITGKYVLTKKVSGIVNTTTDNSGNALIICRDPLPSEASRYALFLYAQSSRYTFDLDGDPASPSDDPFNFARRGQTGSLLTCMGDDFADLTDPSAVVYLRCQDACLQVTVNGALDASSAGGAPLRGEEIGADWYYQVHRSTGYEYSRTPSSSFTILSPGKAFAISTATDESGRITISYMVPQWVRNDSTITDADLTAFLYVYNKSTHSLYTFDVPTFSSGGTIPFNIVVNGGNYLGDDYPAHLGAKAMEKGSLTDTTIKSNEVSYTVYGTISGASPEIMTVGYSLFQNVESLFDGTATLDRSVSPAEFRFSVKSGMYAKVAIIVSPGYSVVPASKTFPTMTSDLNFAFECEANPVVPYGRTVPVLIETYTVEGLQAGDKVSISLSIGGINVTYQRTATGTDTQYPVYGRAGNRITDVTVNGGTDLFVPAFTGNTVEVARMKQVAIVTYASNTDEPTTANAFGDATIRIHYNGGVAETKTSAAGTGSLRVPEGYALSYDYVGMGGQEYVVIPVSVTSGPFSGRESINLHGLVDVVTEVHITLTEERVAYASLYNKSPVNVTILSTEDRDYIVGKTIKFTAPEISGFEFSGWYLGNVCISEESTANVLIEESYDGMALTAVYGVLPEEIPEEGIDGTTLMIGLVAVMIAIICFAYVLLQNKRY